MKALRALLILSSALLLLLLLRFSLRFIPSLTVGEVVVSTQNGSHLPSSSLDSVRKLYGKPMYGFLKWSLEKEIARDPFIESVKVERTLPSSLRFSVTLSPVDAILIAEEDGRAYAVMKDRLFALEAGDEDIWGREVVRVVVHSSYAEFLEKYNVPSSFHDVLSLIEEVDDGTSLITKIKYDNNRRNSFGNVVLELAALHARVSVREEVSPLLLRKALRVVEEDRKNTITLDGSVVFYDVYASGLVRR